MPAKRNIFFPGKRNTEKNIKHVTITNTNIPFYKAKFLGVTKLIATKAKHRIIRLHSICNQSYGPSPATMIRLYKTFVCPLFEYGHIATITASSKNINIWEGIQYKYQKHPAASPHIPRKCRQSWELTIHQTSSATPF